SSARKRATTRYGFVLRRFRTELGRAATFHQNRKKTRAHGLPYQSSRRGQARGRTSLRVWFDSSRDWKKQSCLSPVGRLLEAVGKPCATERDWRRRSLRRRSQPVTGTR